MGKKHKSPINGWVRIPLVQALERTAISLPSKDNLKRFGVGGVLNEC